MSPPAVKKRILLADDDPVILKVTAVRLESEGFEVVAASDGEEAVQRAFQQPSFDLFLLDVNMPRMDGFQVCQRLKRDPLTAAIPIILFTGSADRWQGLTDQCLKLGITDWLRKPFHTGELLEKIRRVLDRKEKRDDA